MRLPRRTFLRGVGATLALPFLDAMVPALTAQAKGAARFAAIYCGNGANMNDWTPGTEGAGFQFSPDPEAARAVSRADAGLQRAGQLSRRRIRAT